MGGRRFMRGLTKKMTRWLGWVNMDGRLGSRCWFCWLNESVWAFICIEKLFQSWQPCKQMVQVLLSAVLAKWLEKIVFVITQQSNHFTPRGRRFLWSWLPWWKGKIGQFTEGHIYPSSPPEGMADDRCIISENKKTLPLP